MDDQASGISRRAMLGTLTSGFGYLAFAGMATQAAARGSDPLAPKPPHFKARAKRVIFLCMQGAPSHVDTFDYKPKLTADSGKPGARGFAKLLGSPWKFSQHGQSGLWISELFPEVARHADKLSLLRGVHTDQPNHVQAFIKLHTGSFQFIRPSLGAWTLYGLGTENENLPGFITLGGAGLFGGAQNFGSSFLPAIYQGTRIGGEPRFGPGFGQGPGGAQPGMSNISNPRISSDAQRAQLDLVQAMNREALRRDGFNPEMQGVIDSFELAFRMQREVPGVMDLSKETKETQQLYGIGEQATESFGRQLLLARRFAEAGVRFIEVGHGNWDHHFQLKASLARTCQQTDKPIAGLLKDLAQRGLLEDTLVIWGGEFGRTPHAQGDDGRDHNNKGFTIWMAGGGVKGGLSYGATDDYGYEAVEKRVNIHDLHATILHLIGLDHERLTYPYAGRNFRLTDVHGSVVKGILA